MFSFQPEKNVLSSLVTGNVFIYFFISHMDIGGESFRDGAKHLFLGIMASLQNLKGGSVDNAESEKIMAMLYFRVNASSRIDSQSFSSELLLGSRALSLGLGLVSVRAKTQLYVKDKMLPSSFIMHL